MNLRYDMSIDVSCLFSLSILKFAPKLNFIFKLRYICSKFQNKI